MEDPFYRKIHEQEKGKLVESEIRISVSQNILQLKKKNSPLVSYKLSKIKTSLKSGILHLESFQGRIHRLSGENSGKVHEKILNIHSLYKFCNSKTEVSMFYPKNILYTNMLPNTLNNNLINYNQGQEKLKETKPKMYLRKNSYLIEEDWIINEEKGGITLISPQKKKNQGKIIKFVLKKFLSTGSFMGISFPVFAMKPESILQTYAKGLGAAPILFNDCSISPTERMKKFIIFLFTISRLMTDMDKPFNPVFGETFQAFIHQANFYAEQVSHHPPKSAIFLQGQGYKIYGTLELVANISINSADGYFYGDLHIQFEDGGRIFGRLPTGCMSGFVIGQNNFNPQGSLYCFDPINEIIWTGKNFKSDIFLGYIGRLKEKYLKRFQETLKTQERFKNFEAFRKKDYETITHEVKAKWSKGISFNDQQEFLFDDDKSRPYLPVKPDEVLKSDSRYREDIPLRAEERMEQAQAEKERIQEQQRYLRKLREKKKK